MSQTCATNFKIEENPEREGFMPTSENMKKEKNPTKCVLISLVVIILLAGFAVGIYFIVETTSKPPQLLGTISSPGKSCLHLKNNEVDDNGYYFIKVDGNDNAFEVYCEMKTAGGGWTLVASIHQIDDEDTCTNENLWYGNASSMASRNWENNNTFGDLASATSADYKNPAYFSLQASDVMIRHLPNNHSVLESDREANLQYHTEDQFLERNGGNLFQAFTKNYPLTPSEGITPNDGPSVLDPILDTLAANGSDLLNVYIPPLYQYIYDDQHPDRLTNGGNNLFDPYGMKVSIEGPSCSIDGIRYGQNYNECGNIASRKSYPFFALLNTGASLDEYLYTVDSEQSQAADERDQSFLLILNVRGYGIFYQTSCERSEDVPSYCDITFTVYSENMWNSTRLDNSSQSHTKFTSSHSNAVYGYTMIAREPGKSNLKLPYEEIVHRIFDIISKFPTIDIPGMLDALVENSSDIVNVSQPLPYKYVYEEDNPTQDTLSDDQDLFLPYGMKINAYTSNQNQPIEYGKSYTLDDGLVQVSSRKSYPFFALMKMNNPNLLKYAGFSVTGGRPRTDNHISVINIARDVTIGDYFMHYYARCSYNLTLPSICDVIFLIVNQKDWTSQKLPYSNHTIIIRDNNASEDYFFYGIIEQSVYTNSIMGYTLLSRQPGQIHIRFPLEDILKNILSVFSLYPFIGLPCSYPATHLVAPVTFTIGSGTSFTNRIPKRFERYTPRGYLQLRAATFNGDYYALCPGVRVETCEPEHVCVGGVKNTNDQVCNAYLDWPPNGTSYTFPEESYYPSSSLSDIASNIMVFYR